MNMSLISKSTAKIEGKDRKIEEEKGNESFFSSKFMRGQTEVFVDESQHSFENPDFDKIYNQ